MPKIAELTVDPGFGRLLRDLRTGASLSLRALAMRTSYSRSFLWDLETGRRQPSLDTARRLDGGLSANGALIALISANRDADGPGAGRGDDLGRARGDRPPAGPGRAARPSAEPVRPTPLSAEYVRTTPPSAEYVRTTERPSAGHPAIDAAIAYWRRLAGSLASPDRRPEPYRPAGPPGRYRLLELVDHADLFEVTRYAGAASGWRTEKPFPGYGDRPVTLADAETVAQVADAYRSVDERRGGGAVHGAVVRFLDSEVAPLLVGRFEAEVGAALLAAAAEAARVAGWAAYDAGLDAVAQWHLAHAVRLARLAGDRALEAEVICAMAHHCAYRGGGAACVDLARIAARAAADAGVDAIRAEAAALEAHGHALVGAATACAMALDRAERTLDRADRARDPAWLRYVDRAYLGARAAVGFLSLDRVDLAARFAAQLERSAARTPRAAAIGAAVAATGYARAGEIEHACALGLDALRATAELRSARVVEFVARLGRALAPYADEPEVREFLARAGLDG